MLLFLGIKNNQINVDVFINLGNMLDNIFISSVHLVSIFTLAPSKTRYFLPVECGSSIKLISHWSVVLLTYLKTRTQISKVLQIPE